MTASIIYREKCHSKLNLFLHVINKKTDGFHNLETLLIPIDWCDEILVRGSQNRNILRKGDFAELRERDLCLRAARALKRLYSVKYGCEITLKKRVPDGAGLGGGSSNAASTLILLNKIWNLNISEDTLAKIGGELGADIPFFLQKMLKFNCILLCSK